MPGEHTTTRDWLDHQVAKYTDVYPVYQTFAKTLDAVLAKAAKGLRGHSIIQTREKKIQAPVTKNRLTAVSMPLIAHRVISPLNARKRTPRK